MEKYFFLIFSYLINFIIKRIRIGIGEPTDNAIDYVLGKPTEEEEKVISEAVVRASNALKEALRTDFVKSMTKYN